MEDVNQRIEALEKHVAALEEHVEAISIRLDEALGDTKGLSAIDGIKSELERLKGSAERVSKEVFAGLQDWESRFLAQLGVARRAPPAASSSPQGAPQPSAAVVNVSPEVQELRERRAAAKAEIKAREEAHEEEPTPAP